ncbi:galactosyltransferase-related protein [Yersinia intermedia]|uniref:Mycofactocin system glycosyltransferase n=3 Tax=Yersinia intermedia TaxID=631 RepID=A0A0T9M8L9_YERIN|nr:galactosyltransferase-related protein [Yersinia intermedia]AJJ19749.1 capsule polysaccharide biosynthesis family protein [Yersinia intermedia]CNF77043.1 mycofactocin system glycosyltransferase [Yersinia intermedia]
MENFKFTVSVIIPVKHRDEYDICQRLLMKSELEIPSNYNFIIIDFGSKSDKASEIQKTCDEIGFEYIYVDKLYDTWNASAARNIGIKRSKSDYLIFEDVDLYHSSDFYNRINIEIETLIESGDWPFFVVPVIYLTELGSDLVLHNLNGKLYSKMIGEIYKPTSDYIVHHASASSFLICKRQDAISIGGYDESFEGWGFEDSDFWVRLLRKFKIERPRDFYQLDTRNYSKQVNWRGWRSLFRIFADLVANKGIYSFHIHHPIAEHRSTAVRAKNHKIFLENCKRYSADNYVSPPLTDENNKKQLFLSKNPHSFNDGVFTYFTNPILIEERFISVYNLEGIVKDNNIESIIFNNPYGNELRLSIYKKAKELGIQTYVIERGALPWSIYIDENGFCAESTSYREENWKNLELTEERTIEVHNYINDIKNSGDSLEPQGNIIGGKNLKKKLFGDSENIKILFIALQSPSDTTTRYFCGDVHSYDNYLNEINMLPYLLPEDWRVVVKNHPLSIEKFSNEKMTNVDSYHIGDILSCCDAVVLLNSGVGIMAQLYEKHVFAFGQAHYLCEGINSQVRTANDVAEIVSQGNYTFDKTKSLKFISFLIRDFYSFANWVRRERKHTEKANLSISVDIEYNSVRIFNKCNFAVEKNKTIDIRESILFDRYRLDEYISRNPIKNNLSNEKSQVKKVDVVSPIEKKSTVNTKPLDDKKSQPNSNLVKKIKKFTKNPKLFFFDAIKKRVN